MSKVTLQDSTNQCTPVHQHGKWPSQNSLSLCVSGKVLDMGDSGPLTPECVQPSPFPRDPSYREPQPQVQGLGLSQPRLVGGSQPDEGQGLAHTGTGGQGQEAPGWAQKQGALARADVCTPFYTFNSLFISTPLPLPGETIFM